MLCTLGFLLCKMHVQYWSESHVRLFTYVWFPPWCSVSDLRFIDLWLWFLQPGSDPIACWSVGTEVLIVHAHRGRWASWPQALTSCSACLNLLLLLHLYLCVDSSECLICLNFELLLCSSPSMLPFSIVPVSPRSWLLYPAPRPRLNSSYVLFCNPLTSPLPVTPTTSCLSILLVLAFPGLSHPAADQISAVIHGIDCQGKKFNLCPSVV